jgi:transposase
MDKITHIGLDVHKETIAVATLHPEALTCDERVIPNTPEAIRKLVARMEDPSGLRVCYEAGPTGYDTQRLLSSLGVDCKVVAPALIPRRPGVRTKTDRLDARNLARLHRAGELTPIRIPTAGEEALRDLIRTREDLKCDRRIARQRIKSFLLKHGRRYPRTTAARWSGAFQAWARTQKFSEPAAQAAFCYLLAAEKTRDAQLSAIDAEIMKAAAEPDLAPGVGGLRCFRGIDTLSAVTILAKGGGLSPFWFGRRLHGLHRAYPERAFKWAFRAPRLHHQDR